MIGGKWFDMIVGIDIHWVMVPTPAPVPTPLPHPFVGLIYDPMGLAVGTAIGAVIGAIAGAPPTGPVLINCLPASATGTEGTNKMIMPHFPTPPGVSWAGVPAGIKPPIPGKKANPGAPVPMPSNDAIIITGSKTVHIMGTNATRLGDLVMSCGEPVRLPSSTVIAVPMGPPVIIGGPPALDFVAAFMGLIRTSWVSGRLNALAGRVFGAGSRGARWASKIICMVTGHPVDVISGMVLTDAVDIALPGPIGFRFERNYASRSESDGPLGAGWSHTYDQWVRFEERRIVYRAGDGRDIYFPLVEPMQFARNDSEGLELRREKETIVIVGKDRLKHVFAPASTSATWPIQRLENARGQTIEFRYDAAGRLKEAVDSAQRLIGFEHDDHGRLKALTLPHPTQAGARFVAARYVYDAHGDLVAVHDALDQPTRYFYKHHLLVQETDRNGFSFYFAYDGVTSEARCVRTWGDGGIFDHVLTYDVPKHITVKEDSYGATTIFHGNDAGLVEKIVDSLGRTRTFKFDQANRTVEETEPTGAATVIEYDAGGNILSVQNADGERRAYKYDEFDQEILEKVGAETEIRYDYTTYGELLDTRTPVGGGFKHQYAANGDLTAITSRSGRRLSLTWDASNPTSFTAPGEETIHAKYDVLGAQIELRYPTGEVIRFNRDLLGRTTSLTSSVLGTSRYEYNGAGRVVRWTGPGGHVTDYTLGQFNKLLAVTDPVRGQRRFEYDKEGDVVAFVNEKGERLEYHRNSEGDVTKIVDFAGRETTFAFDAAGRIAKIGDHQGKHRALKWTPGGRLKEVAYADGCFEKYAYNSLGAIVAVENEAGKLSRTYDLVGRLVGESWNDFSLTHQYDLDDSRTLTRASDGTVQRFEYDAGARATRLEWNDRWTVRRAYNKLGELIQSELPGEQIEKRSYDANGYLFEQRVDRRGRGLLTGRQYQFNKGGELSALFDRQRGATAYVIGHQGLEKVLRDEKIVESYKFDATGNRLLPNQPMEIGPGGRLLRQGDLHYRYDDDGRVIEKAVGEQTWRYAYNDRGQMIKCVTPDEREIQFAYDPIGRRVLKRSKDRETRWTWLDNRPYRLDDRAGGRTSTTHFFYEPDGLTPLGAAVDGKYFNLISDHLGTLQEAFDERGGLAWAGDYMAWGNLRRSLAPSFQNPLRFPGQWFDEETGLHYNFHRYYDPDTARYLTPDPIGVKGGFHFYAYPLNPIGWADPLGLAGCIRTYVRSWKIFLMSGIRPKHARAIMAVCEREGVEAGFRNIKWWKRAQSMVQGMLGVPPKPMSVKGKVGPLGTVTEHGVPFRSDYDPTFYRGSDGRVLTNDEALALNQRINNEIGSNELQHGTHNTMDQAGVPPETVRNIGPPGDTTVIRPDGSSSAVSNSDMMGDPSIPWLW
jgi:RHS repeat-associated protein